MKLGCHVTVSAPLRDMMRHPWYHDTRQRTLQGRIMAFQQKWLASQISLAA
jgi:hypothetical protein